MTVYLITQGFNCVLLTRSCVRYKALLNAPVAVFNITKIKLI